MPFRRDCRACIEAMGTQHPHRRSKTASAAFTLAIDIIGPFTSVKDLATGRMARYALLGTVPIPVPDQLPSAPEVETLEEEHLEGVEPVEGLDEEEEVGDQDPGPGDDEEVMGEAMEEGEEPVEQVDLEAIQELKRPHDDRDLRGSKCYVAASGTVTTTCSLSLHGHQFDEASQRSRKRAAFKKGSNMVWSQTHDPHLHTR